MRRRMCAKATLTAAGSGASTEGTMAGCLLSERPEIAVSKRPPEFESAAAIYANKTVEEERARATPEKLERWIRDSIGEVNIRIELGALPATFRVSLTHRAIDNADRAEHRKCGTHLLRLRRRGGFEAVEGSGVAGDLARSEDGGRGRAKSPTRSSWWRG